MQLLTTEIIQAIGFTGPIICAICCMVFMCMDGSRKGLSRQDRHLRLFLATTYLVAALCWTGLVLYITSHKLFVYYQSVFLLTLMLDQVMIYRVVYILTNTGSGKNISILHILIPTAIVVISIFSALSVPVGQQISVIFEGNSGVANWWFRIFYTATTLLFIIYNTLYPVLGLLRIKRYRRLIVNYSADMPRTSLGWLSAMLILTLITVPVPLSGLLLGINIFTSTYFTWLGAFPTFLVYVIICYNLLTDNYIIVSPDLKGEEIDPEKFNIDRRKFERCMRDKKPYLNPKLRVTEVAALLNTNRSYLSAFINGEYGMNFSQYINRLRLEELDRLRSSISVVQYTNMELVLMAGFSNYRSYLRAKDEEDKHKILKVFE